jgi:hypothetical protein
MKECNVVEKTRNVEIVFGRKSLLFNRFVPKNKDVRLQVHMGIR